MWPGARDARQPEPLGPADGRDVGRQASPQTTTMQLYTKPIDPAGPQDLQLRCKVRRSNLAHESPLLPTC